MFKHYLLLFSEFIFNKSEFRIEKQSVAIRKAGEVLDIF